MLFRIAGVLLLMVVVTGQPNYQERAVYYGEEDGVCCQGFYSDSMNLIINIDDRSRVKRIVSGGTACASR